MYDYLIVGAGLFGSIFAHEANKLGKKILVIDKRDHIGGNCYTKKIDDYHEHVYGPHIFHTSQKYIWDYVNKFSSFNNFSLRVKSKVKNKLYSLPLNLITFNQIWPEIVTPEDAKNKISSEIIPCSNPKNLEEYMLSIIGPTVYELLIKNYTIKQWGKNPSDLPVSIVKRLPIRFDMNDRYFHESHIYEGIPDAGYTQIFENMLQRIPLQLNVDYFENREYFDKIAKKIVYSGPIDKYFDYMHGRLDYRSLKFETKKFYKTDFQGNAIINYPELNVDYTRIVQHRHFTFSKSKIDTITYEYPENFGNFKEPYYPINDLRNNEIYSKYYYERKKINNLIIGGRLGNYKYYDMDMSIANSLKTVQNEFN